MSLGCPGPHFCLCARRFKLFVPDTRLRGKTNVIEAILNISFRVIIVPSSSQIWAIPSSETASHMCKIGDRLEHTTLWSIHAPLHRRCVVKERGGGYLFCLSCPKPHRPHRIANTTQQHIMTLTGPRQRCSPWRYRSYLPPPPCSPRLPHRLPHPRPRQSPCPTPAKSAGYAGTRPPGWRCR